MSFWQKIEGKEKETDQARSWLSGLIRESEPDRNGQRSFLSGGKEFLDLRLAAKDLMPWLQNQVAYFEQTPFDETAVHEKRQRSHEEIFDLCETVLADRQVARKKALALVFSEDARFLQTIVTSFEMEKQEDHEASLRDLQERLEKFLEKYPEALSDPGFPKSILAAIKCLPPPEETEKFIIDRAREFKKANLESARRELREAIMLANLRDDLA